MKPLAVVVACAWLVASHVATAPAASQLPPAITTPDRVDSRLGTLEPFFTKVWRPSEIEIVP